MGKWIRADKWVEIWVGKRIRGLNEWVYGGRLRKWVGVWMELGAWVGEG